MRTRTDFCASTSPRAPICRATPSPTSMPSPPPSTGGPARPSAGAPPPNHSTNIYALSKAVLRQPLEPGLGSVIGVVHDVVGVAGPGQGHRQRGDGHGGVLVG